MKNSNIKKSFLKKLFQKFLKNERYYLFWLRIGNI